MKYKLSFEQYKTLWGWNSIEQYENHNTKLKRYAKFAEWYPNLQYAESYDEYEKGYWGIVEGSEADITMLILKL